MYRRAHRFDERELDATSAPRRSADRDVDIMLYEWCIDVQSMNPSIHPSTLKFQVLYSITWQKTLAPFTLIPFKSLDLQLPSPVLASCKMARHLTIFDQEFHEIMLARGFTPVPTQHSSIIPSQVIHGIAPNLTAII